MLETAPRLTDPNDFQRWLADVHFRDAYEIAYGVRPQFTVDYLTDFELAARTCQIQKFSGRYPRY